MAGLILAGNVYINRLTDAGASTGFLDPVNTTKLAISNPDPDKKERISRMRDTLGQALDSVNFPKPAEISIAIDDQPRQIMAMALLGEDVHYSQGAGTVTDEAVVLIPGRWVPLARRNVNQTGFVLTTAAAPSTPLVEGTDYAVNRVAGLVKALPGGAIATATNCLVDYGHAAVNGHRILGAAKPTIRCRILVDGVNRATGAQCRLEVYDATLSPAGEIDFMSGEFITTELKGTLRTPEGMGQPYVYEEYAAA